MIRIMRAMRALVAVAVLGVALQPCLACVDESEGPAVRSEAPCHGTTPQVATACTDALGAPVAVAPTVHIGMQAPLLALHELDLCALCPPGRATAEPIAPADGPPLWLRHASLLV